MDASGRILPLLNPLPRKTQEQSEAGKEDGSSLVRNIRSLPTNGSALGKREGAVTDCADNLHRDGRKIQKTDISSVLKESETLDINEHRESACFKKTDPYRAERIRDLIKNGRYSDRTQDDTAFIEKLASERARLFFGKVAFSGCSGTSLKLVKDFIFDPCSLEIPLDILGTLNQEQLEHLHWMADNGFGINLDFAQDYPENIPDSLLIKLLRNRYISDYNSIHGKIIPWLFTHDNPEVVEYALNAFPAALNYLAIDKLCKIQWPSDEGLSNTLDKFINYYFKNHKLFEKKSSLHIRRPNESVLALLTLCDFLLKRNDKLFYAATSKLLQHDNDTIYWTACFLGFPDIASAINKPNSDPSVALLAKLAFYSSYFTKELDPNKQKAFCENYLFDNPADRAYICTQWFSEILSAQNQGIYPKKMLPSFLNTKISLSLLPSLLKNITLISAERLFFESLTDKNGGELSKTDISILTCIFVNECLDLIPACRPSPSPFTSMAVNFQELGVYNVKFFNVIAYMVHGLDIKKPCDFKNFMDRLIDWKSLNDPSIKKSICQLPDGFKSLRHELLGFIEAHGSTSIDTRRYNLGVYEQKKPTNLLKILMKTEFFKYKIIGSFLEHGTKENVQALLQHWLENPSGVPARQWLFQQFLHPNNTFFDEHINCNVLLNAALNLLPAPPENTMFDASISKPEIPDDEALALMSQQPDSRINRTLIFKKNDKTEYLKIQTSKESRDAFCTQYQRLKYLSDYTSTLKLKSHCGKPEGLYTTTLETLNLSDSDRFELTKTVGFDQRLIMRFSLPKDKPYEVYVNSPDITPEDALRGLLDHAHDYGTLWNLGFNGPDALSAYHDEKSGRRFHFLAEIAHIINLGVIDQWRLNALYPNIGVVGMRDHGDTRPCREFNSDHLSSSSDYNDHMSVNPNDLTDINRVRLLALAQTAWGMVLLWGDRYNSAMEKATTAEQMEQAKADNAFKPAILPMLSTLFSRAFNMEQGECERIMQEDGLYDQAVREMGYWMDNVNAPYVDDMKAHRINREVYPDYPENLRAPTFSEQNLRYLTPNGFISESAKNLPGRQSLYSHLGCVPNGRNPLLSLNALVVKMITLGCLNLSRETSS